MDASCCLLAHSCRPRPLESSTFAHVCSRRTASILLHCCLRNEFPTLRMVLSWAAPECDRNDRQEWVGSEECLDAYACSQVRDGAKGPGRVARRSGVCSVTSIRTPAGRPVCLALLNRDFVANRRSTVDHCTLKMEINSPIKWSYVRCEWPTLRAVVAAKLPAELTKSGLFRACGGQKMPGVPEEARNGHRLTSGSGCKLARRPAGDGQGRISGPDGCDSISGRQRPIFVRNGIPVARRQGYPLPANVTLLLTLQFHAQIGLANGAQVSGVFFAMGCLRDPCDRPLSPWLGDTQKTARPRPG